MAMTIFRRIWQRLRAAGAHIGAFILFSGLLTYVFILYQPTKGPGELQKLGWQSWDVVTPQQRPTIQKPEVAGETIIEGASKNETETDWWDVESVKTSSLDASSLPLDYWDPLLPHETGLTEIAITRCVLPPWAVDLCWPKTTEANSANKGRWVRVERDLNRQAGAWYLHMYYRRTRKLDVPLIIDLRLLPENGESNLPDRDSWYSSGVSTRDGVRGTSPLFLWWKLGPTLREIQQRETNITKKELITEIDVVYGAGPAMAGFDILEPDVTKEETKRVPVRIAYRRGPPAIPRAPPLHFNRDGKYKVLQIADLHFSTSHGKCRDTNLTPCKQADDLTMDLVSRTLDAEKPDFVVFTGDQLNGQKTSWDSRSVLAKFAIPVIQRKIPWTAVFGNHDDETDMDREFEMRHLTQLPYYVGTAGPKDVHGIGNFVLKVYSADPSKTHLLTLYLLDSGAYDAGVLSFFGFYPTGYDYIRESQIDWFLSESAKVPYIERPFTPDGAKDLEKLWDRQAIKKVETLLAKPNALMFFHIPLQEAYSKADKDPSTSKPLDVGQQLDAPGASKKNAGFFEKGILNATETKDGRGTEVKVIGNGHCHLSENCRRVKGVWMCFGGGGSYAGYGKIGFDRRFRVYNISDYGETIMTYKRTEHGTIMDQMVLAGAGAPPL